MQAFIPHKPPTKPENPISGPIHFSKYSSDNNSGKIDGIISKLDAGNGIQSSRCLLGKKITNTESILYLKNIDGDPKMVNRHSPRQFR